MISNIADCLLTKTENKVKSSHHGPWKEAEYPCYNEKYNKKQKCKFERILKLLLVLINL